MKFDDFVAMLSNPAKNALEHAGINSFHMLASLSKKELLSIHGIGPKTLAIVNESLEHMGMKLRG